jgi:hypothetical protein
MPAEKRPTPKRSPSPRPVRDNDGEKTAHGPRPTPAQARYLERGLIEPGGKLPLFDREGREIPRRTIESCLAAGWAEPWFANPIKPDWIVARLTEAGRRALAGKDG